MTVRPIPVLPAVPSMMVSPGRRLPLASASMIIPSAARSFDRAAGIHELGLSKDFAACQFRQTAQPDDRSFANVLLNPMKTRGAPTIAFSHLCLSTFVLL